MKRTILSLIIACVCVVACLCKTSFAADLYWDINGATANGDGAGQWANSLGRISTSSSGTVTTANWSNSGNNAKSFQFGFGTTAGGNATNGGTVTVGSSGGTNGPSVGSIIFNASGNASYTLQNTSTTTSNNLTINTGGADVTAGLGIVVNSNVVGDTTFQQNPAAGSLGSFSVALGANQTWQNNSSTFALNMNVPVTGAFSLTTNGVGTIVLGGSNSFSGGLTVSQGLLRATNANALGSGAVTVSSTGTLDIRAAITKNVSNSGTVSIGAGGNLSASSLGGALTLGGVSGTTATFTSTLGSGTLALGSLAATGNTAISLAAGSQINASGTVNFTGASNLLTLTGAAATPGTYTLIQGSSLSGTSGLSLTGGAVGSGTIALGSTSTVGRNTYQFNSTSTALQLAVTGTIFNLTWDSTVASGTWNQNGSAVWLQDNAGSPITFFNTDNVTFGSAATVAVPTAVAPGTMAISNATGSVDLSGAGAITATSLTKSGAGSATIANNLTVANGVTMSAGTLSTSGSLAVTAGGIAVNGGSLATGSTTTITAGGLTVSGGLYTANGATTVTAGGVLVNGGTFNATAPTTISASGITVSSGSASLGAASAITGDVTVSGGNLVLNAANTVSGTTSVTGGGVLSVGATGAIGSNAATINNGTLVATTNGISMAAPITVGASGATVTNSGSFTLSGAITGSSNVITKAGAGELTISNAVGSSRAGVQFNVNAGSLVFSGASVKELNGPSVFTGNVTINSSTMTLSTSAGITGSGTLAMTGTSTINVRNGSTGGTKTVATPLNLNGTASLVATSGGNLIFTGPVSGSGDVTTSGAAKVGLTGTAGTFAGTLTVNNSGQNGFTEINTLALHNATSVVVNRNASLTAADGDFQITNTAQDEFAALISGAGILSISSGTNRAILSGTNTFSGGSNLKGDVGIRNNSALGSGTITALTADARVFWDGAATTGTIANALSTGTVSSYTLSFLPGSGKTVVLTGLVSGSGKLEVDGGGDLDLTQLAGNSATGGIDIGTGRLLVSTTANLGGGAINFFTAASGSFVALANMTLANSVTAGAGVTGNIDTGVYSVTIPSFGSGSARLAKTGEGLLTISNASSFTGGTLLSAGTIGLGSSSALGSGTITINGGGLASETTARTPANNIVVGGDFFLGGLGNSITLSGSVDLGNAARTITLKNSATLGGVVSNGGLTLAATGNSRLTLNGTNTYSLGTTVNSGTLVAGSTAAFGTGGLTVNGGGVDLNGRSITVGALSGSAGAVITSGSTGSIVLTSSAATNSTFGGSLGNGSGTVGLAKSGAGTLTLSGSNGYTGATTVSGGVLALVNSNALGAGSVTVAGGATLDVRAAVTNNVITNSGTVNVGPGGNLSTNSIAGSGAVTLGGVSGTTATFTSTLSSGTLSLGSLSAIGNTNISLAAGSQILTTGALGFSGVSNLITLTGGAAPVGTYTLLQGSSLTTSGLSLTGGAVGNATISLGSSATVGRNTYAFGSTATALTLNVTGSTYNLVWNGGASGTWDSSALNWQQDGLGPNIAFANSDNVTINSAATIAVPASVTAGTMVISNATGSVDLSGAGAITATTLSKSGAGAATIANTGTVSSGVTVSAGSLATSGPLSVTAGGVLVNGGSFTASSGVTISGGGITVSSGSATLGTASTITGGVAVSGGGLALNAANTVSGVTSVTGGGVLSVGATGAIGTGTATINGGTLVATTGGITVAAPIAVGASGATVSNAGTLTLSGAITGSSNVLTKTGAGNLILSGTMGASAQGVTVNVNAGTLTLTGAGIKEFGNVNTFNGDVTLDNAVVFLAQTGTFQGTGTIYATGTSSITRRSSASGGTGTIFNALDVSGTFTANSSSSRNIEFAGPISGSGAMVTGGVGRVTLSSGTSGGFSGPLTINSSGANGLTEITSQAVGTASSITVNYNASRPTSTNLQIANTVTGTISSVISGSGNIAIAAGTTRAVLTGTNTGYSGITLVAGDVGITNASALGTGLIQATSANGRIFWDGATSAVTLANNLSTGAASSSALAFAGAGKTWTPTGTISGSGQLKVSSGAIVDLRAQSAASSTYTGGVEIGTGSVIVDAADDFGSGGGAVNFGTGTASFLVVGGTGTNLTLSNPFTIGSASGNGYTANFDTNGNSLTIASAINDRAGNANGGLLNKVGAGTLTLSASNGYTGNTTVSAGTLVAGNPNAFGTGTITLNAGTLDLGSQAVANALTVNGGSLANLQNYAGTQTLFTTMTYSGTVGGTLNVAAGGTLKGSGVTFTGPVVIGDGAIHAPGTSPGIETFTSGLTYSGSSSLQWELIGNTTSGVGSNYDAVTVSGGALSIVSGAGLALIFNGSGSTVDWNDAFWNSNQSWTVIDASGAGSSSGIFSLLGSPSTWVDSNSLSLLSAMAVNNRTTSTFTVDNSTGSIVLNYTTVIVPEPAALVLVAIGVGGLVLGRRRKRL